MGRLTEHLRSDGVCKGCDYELQGSDAKKESSPGPVTADVNGTMIGPSGPLSQRTPSVSPGDLKTKLGPG